MQQEQENLQPKLDEIEGQNSEMTKKIGFFETTKVELEAEVQEKSEKLEHLQKDIDELQ